MSFLSFLKPKPKPTVTVIPNKTWYGLDGSIIDPLSFIAEHFGEVKSKFKIVGLINKSDKYMLFPWLNIIEAHEKKHGYITGRQIIEIGVANGCLEKDLSLK